MERGWDKGLKLTGLIAGSQSSLDRLLDRLRDGHLANAFFEGGG